MNENASSRAMGLILEATPFLASVTLVKADSWQAVSDFAKRAGLAALEILLRTPHAPSAVRKIKEQNPALKVGLGTILNTRDFDLAQASGADFAVSPGFTPDLLLSAQGSGLAFLPGVMTPSEVMQVSEAGFWNAKLFPAGYLKDGYIKSLEGPFPHMKFCVSGSISEESWSAFAPYLQVRTVSGAWIIPNSPMTEDAIEKWAKGLTDKVAGFAAIRSAQSVS